MNVTQNETAHLPRASRIQYRRRHGQAGQSAIIAVIVLFLLLFLATIFIAIVARNITNTRNAANTSASRRFADAGLNYLDKQFMDSPEGADWRPIPDSQVLDRFDVNADGDYVTQDVNGNGIVNTEVSETDPDYRYLHLYRRSDGTGGFTRVNFGAETGGGQDASATVGGRSLVRVTYQPNSQDPLSRYIKIEAVGRIGQINPLDPTTYQNTEGISQRVELVAYKAIGLNEYTRFVTNRDNKPVSVGLGSPFDVRDRGALRPVPTFIDGAIRVNAGLTFYGTNYISLNPYRGDAIEVSGPIRLNNVADATDSVTANDPTRVFVGTPVLGANDINPGFSTPNVFPSDSANFTTLGPILADKSSDANAPLVGLGLVRDNPRGSETQVLNPETDEQELFNGQKNGPRGNAYQNLRSTPRLSVPIIDAPTGPGGLTRYRSLTRDSAPLDPEQVVDNPIRPGIIGNAGTFGWGQGLYLPNTNDTQAASASLFSGYSARSDWLNPASGRQPSARTYWRGDLQYVPPAVTITLTPRYMKITRSVYDNNNGQQAFNFRDNTGGRLRNIETIVRYTKVQAVGSGNGNKPSPNLTGVNLSQEYQGYPATQTQPGVYEGEYVIFAEGNVRIKGVVGGLDSESGAFFKRHLTVVSNGTIYVDGNLLRDNIRAGSAAPASTVQGQSTIALLAKQYIAVNTTQFLSLDSPGFTNLTPESGVDANNQPVGDNAEEPRSLVLNPSNPQLLVNPIFGPLLTATGFVQPPYLTGGANTLPPGLFLRHRTASQSRGATITLGLNRIDATNWNYFNFEPFNLNVPNSSINLALNQFDTNGSVQGGAFLNEHVLLPVAAPLNLNGAAPENLFQMRQEILPDYEGDYQVSRVGIAPLDIRIEAMMYAQEGSFFIIPGPWFNANPNDTYEHYELTPDDVDGQPFRRRYGQIPATTNPPRKRVDSYYPFYREPMDIRITLCGSITENLPAEIADQGAWMEKWGWVPRNYGSTGLTTRTGFPEERPAQLTMHGPGGPLSGPNNAGNGIVYEFDERAIAPYAPTFSAGNGLETVGGINGLPRPLRRNPYNPYQPLPFAPRLPVAPGFLYYGQPTDR